MFFIFKAVAVLFHFIILFINKCVIKCLHFKLIFVFWGEVLNLF